MINVWQFSPIAGDNDSAPPDGAPEGMPRSQVNDTLRELYAAIARFRDDIAGVSPSNGVLSVAGTGTAYTLATNQAPTVLENGFTVRFTVAPGLTNTGAVTLNVDGLGAKEIRGVNNTNLVGGELVSRSSYTVTFHQPSNSFILHSFYKDAGIPAFPSGTRMLFQQTTVPTQWVKDVSAFANNKALRLVNGTVVNGGTTAFTSVFAARTILQANLPNYNLPHNLSLPNHVHPYTLVQHSHADTFDIGGDKNSQRFGGQNRQHDAPGGNEHQYTTGMSTTNLSITGSVGNVSGSLPTSNTQIPTSNPSIGGTVPSGGSGTALDFAVAYVDVVIGVKS